MTQTQTLNYLLVPYKRHSQGSILYECSGFEEEEGLVALVLL